MKRCARTWETEELALGLAPADRALAIRAHMRACPQCAEEFARLQRERALFARRADAMAAMPLELHDVLARLRSEQPRAGAGWRARSMQVAVAIAAAAAVVLTLHTRAWLAWPANESEPPAALPVMELSSESWVQPCTPGPCMQSSILECEPVTCVQPATLVAHSEPAACSELPWLDCGWEGTQ